MDTYLTPQHGNRHRWECPGQHIGNILRLQAVHSEWRILSSRPARLLSLVLSVSRWWSRYCPGLCNSLPGTVDSSTCCSCCRMEGTQIWAGCIQTPRPSPDLWTEGNLKDIFDNMLIEETNNNHTNCKFVLPSKRKTRKIFIFRTGKATRYLRH